MKNLIRKELGLATPPITFLFLAFTLMTFLPGYPILCGAFFVCFGIFQSYQSGREDNDILYSVLLPVKKTDAVRAKYAAAVLLQLAAFLLCAVFTLIRMLWLSGAGAYAANPLMNANLVFLAFVLLIFLSFNVIFLGGFFRTAYGIGRPFVRFVIVNFAVIGLAETLPHLPGLDWMGVGDFGCAGRQGALLLGAALAYGAATAASCRASQRSFERIDL